MYQPDLDIDVGNGGGGDSLLKLKLANKKQAPVLHTLCLFVYFLYALLLFPIWTQVVIHRSPLLHFILTATLQSWLD